MKNFSGLTLLYVLIVLSVLYFVLIIGCENNNNNKTIIWTLDSYTDIGGYTPEVLGSPKVITDESGTSISFNGESDGLIIPVNPIEDWEQFTIEVLFIPDSDGSEEQRFIHFQDETDNRGLIETRINSDKSWALDTFLFNRSTDFGLTLLDRDINHPADEWYWAALVYDGITMSHYVNGRKELEGEIEFSPMGPGMISVGVRLNQVHWFKGNIREIRFHPKSLESEKLQSFIN